MQLIPHSQVWMILDRGKNFKDGPQYQLRECKFMRYLTVDSAYVKISKDAESYWSVNLDWIFQTKEEALFSLTLKNAEYDELLLNDKT